MHTSGGQEWGDCIAKRTGPPPLPCTVNTTYMMELGRCECVGNDTIDDPLMLGFNCTHKQKTATELYF